ncbi:MAG: MnhB domain-containing protein, partial [Halobacteriales archaeon]
MGRGDGRPLRARAGRAPGPNGGGRVSTVIARTVARLTVPLILVTAVALLLQGHNLPGGGFIAAV